MSCHCYVKRAYLVLSQLSPLMCWCSFVKASGELDLVSAAGRAMTTKRKAENHTRAGNLPVIMKPGRSQADSERDSGFSGLVTLLHIKILKCFWRWHLIWIEPQLTPFIWSIDASSEHMSTMDTTDSEDSPHPVVQQGPRTTGSGTHPSGLAVVGGLSPMIIMNNVLLKQVIWGKTSL